MRVAREALLDEHAQELLRHVQDVICETNRSQIVRALATSPLSVNDLSRVIQRSKSATSRHLRVLRDAGVVSARRRGRNVYYSLGSGPVVDSAVGALNVVARAAAAAQTQPTP